MIEEAAAETPRDDVFTQLDPNAIRVRKDFNPRRYFDPTKLTDLAEKIGTEGVIQPVLVRPSDTDDGYELVAGERRLRASIKAGLSTVPAYVRRLSLQEAQRIALSENNNREGLSEAEEARYARSWVDASDGDRDQAAKELGWSRRKLDARLLLTHCTDAVLDALESRQIKIGHAELLSGQPATTQDNSIAKIIERGLSVADLKKIIGSFATPLSQAIFDRTECQSCPHNTGFQSNLFDNALDGANCQKRSCFAAKTREAVQQKREALADEYHVVRFASEVTASTSTVLLAEGHSGVGRRQLEQCRACPYHGAVVTDTVDENAGELQNDTCFNLSCHAEKVKENRKALQPEPATPRDSGQSASSTSKASAGKGAKTKAQEGPAVTRALQNHVNHRLVQAADQAVVDSHAHTLRYAILGLYTYIRQQDGQLTGDTKKGEAQRKQRVEDALRTVASETNPVPATEGNGWLDDTKLLRYLMAVDVDRLQNVQAEIAGVAASAGRDTNSPGMDAASKRAYPVLTHEGRRLADCAPVDADMLATLPRKGMEALLTDVGFYEWIDQQDDAADRRKRLKQAKAKELPAVVMAEGYDFTGKCPSLLKAYDPIADDSGKGTNETVDGEASDTEASKEG